MALSASDLTAAAACEFAVLRELDARMGRIEVGRPPADAMLERVAALGSTHEASILSDYVARFGEWNGTSGVATVERPGRDDYDVSAVLAAKHVETLSFLASGADVVYQGALFDGVFVGWVDFLVRDGHSWQVQDTKLARHAKVEALLQLAAYADQLQRAGVAVSDEVVLLLGSGVASRHRTHDLIPVYRQRMDRLRNLVETHVAGGEAIVWGADGVASCLRCEACAPFVEETRDVLLVAGLSVSQRAKLASRGVHTVEELAASSGPVDGIGAATLARLRSQARLQAEQDAANAGLSDDEPPVVRWEIVEPAAIATLPAPDEGDIFFDFEGDPLWFDPTASVDGVDAWGLEYLFGVIEAPVAGSDPVFRPFWAHDRAQEKVAMAEFMTYLTERRAAYPGMHVYHYAAYERTALLRLAGRHGVGEDALDQLLREGVLVDLYATVRAAVRTGQRSYSLKKVEALYGMAHEGAVEKADESIVAYAQACALRDDGDDVAWRKRLDEIADYNRTDCLSTLRLRDWLLERAPGAATPGGAGVAEVVPGDGDEDADARGRALDPLDAPLLAFADSPDGPGGRNPEQQAAAMLAAGLGYHWREAKPFWWAHYDRLSSDPSEWTEKRSTMVADQVDVVEGWHVPPRARTQKRVLRMVGRLEPGSDLRAGAKVNLLYDPPVPPGAKVSERGLRGWRGEFEIQRVDVTGDDDRDAVTLVEGGVAKDDVGHAELPMGLAPTPGPATTGIEAALHALAASVVDGLPGLPDCAALDLLRRVPPRTRSGRGLVRAADDVPLADALVATLRDLEHSYVAVQGPPGTGKTFVGARVVKALVESGWRVGVVAQSHAVVENFLRAALDAGLSAHVVGKKPDSSGSASAPPAWTKLGNDFTGFFATHPAGLLVGGTAWDFTNPARIPSGGYDLLVVDEAGQFALANTIAVAGAAASLLLLGDPQQLPQVSQGTHPEPVDESALGWLSDGHDTLPDSLGYFLPTTWRLHPDLCDAVSHLSYDGRLTAAPAATARRLDGVESGVRGVPVPHAGNTVRSVEEATEVVRQIRALVARTWHDGTDRRPLTPADVLVVAAYNAQVWAIRHALDAAGYRDTRVGTVDKFQGKEAPVVLVSMAASSPEDVPRGMEFLLDRNRLNVAISRGQWCARIIHSPALADYLPSRPDQLENLGAFLRLIHRA
jgi:uncharacterized protein